MSGFVGVNLINFENLSPDQKKALLKKLKSRQQALENHLKEVEKSLDLVEQHLKRQQKSKR